uniref:RRM domain-containing protein n=1 Tax=Solanum lycopersicum TaxID=4081 RepID=A0A3Q7FQ90_SOLLC
MSARTVKVSNVSLSASEQDIKEFFSFSGDIEYVEMMSENERSQIAYVTFKDLQGAETAVLLSGATIIDQSVTIVPEPDYELPPTALVPIKVCIIYLDILATESANAAGGGSAIQKAEDVVSSMLAKGFILGKDAVNKAKTFDEKHQFTSTASAKVASLDQKIGLSEKINLGATIVNDKVKEMDQKFHVSEKTKSALAAAEQTVSTAGSAIMKNRYVLTGASWVTGAFNKVTKAAGEVGQKTKEKMAEEQQAKNSAEGYVPIHALSESPKASKTEEPTKPSSPKGLIL